MSIYIPTLVNDMQGPCNDGFHIPTSTEMSAMWTMLQSITGSSSYNNLLTYLRMPLAGMWEDWGGTYGMGSAANYYTCSVSGANAIRFFYNSGGVSPTATINREYAFPIRPFKDTPVVPDSSWTDSYTSGNKKISINTTLGLISMTSDGENWLTIADKNVGATTVYNNGDTLSQSNCGEYFQWGNNYGFPFSGTITKSSTKVDASSYGPGNYYESNTFITGGGDWSTVQNDNLRGGVSQGVSTKCVETKNIYIGEYKVNYLVDMDDINLQSQWTSPNGIVVSGNNPVVYTGPGSDRYRGGYTTQTWTLPTKGRMYIDGIRGPHNYSGESWRGICNTNTQLFAWRQRSVTDSTSYPSIIIFGNFYDISLDYRSNDRHIFIIEWDNGVANAWLDDTQVLTNTTYSHSSQTFFFQIQGGRISSGGADNPKSIYDFYVESLD